jgi:hypothetical protein
MSIAALSRIRLPSLALRAFAACTVVLALAAAPAPLLPPERLSDALQPVLGGNVKAAYLLAALGMHLLFYGLAGAMAAFAIPRAEDLRGLLLQLTLLPCVVVALAISVRSIKLGHLPMAGNALVPIVACVAGAGLGVGLRYHAWKAALAAAAILAAALGWTWLASPSAALAHATEQHLRRLAAAQPAMPEGDARFGRVLEIAFARERDERTPPLEHNRAALLAIGIALGDERVARLAGVALDADLSRALGTLRDSATVRGRNDWSRHFSLSAALAVLHYAFASDAAGLMKEELDALTRGSGFSFADLAADRTGVRFALAAMRSPAAAEAMQSRLARGFVPDDIFPAIADLPENLTLEAFRRDYGGVGSARYRRLLAAIEARLDDCPALRAR